MTPKRIQLSRRRGWSMPPNTVKVSRPAKWGNRFAIGRHYRKGDIGDGVPRLGLRFVYTEAFEGHQDKTYTTIKTRAEAVDWYRWYVSTWGAEMLALVRTELSGKNLACFCPLDQPCHADVLLELAARDAGTGGGQ